MKYNIKKYKGYLVLLISIILLLIIFNIVYSNKKVYIDIFGTRLKASEEILMEKDDEIYLSFDFVKEKIDDEIYFDNISKKAVISKDNILVKAKLNEKMISKNFNDEEIKNIGVIQKEKIYISLEVLKNAYNLEIAKCNNTVYIFNKESFECKAKTNNVKLYITCDIKSKAVDSVDKKDKIIGIFEAKDFVFVKVNKNKYGYISKNMLKYLSPNKEEEKIEKKKKVYMFADNNVKDINKNMNIDGIYINMFDVTKQDCSVSVRNINNGLFSKIKQNNMKAYGIVTNGYNLTGFTTSTTTQILSDESKRMLVINNLVEKTKEYNLDGIVIDFRMIKEDDTHNYIQFIKEIKAFSDKEIIINIDGNEYKNYIEVINYSDYAILNLYGLRKVNSIVSGSVSDISWMEEVINNTLKVANGEKIIIGIPAYSILWTEKNSNVVNAEIYNLKAIEQYIQKNKLEKKYNKSTKQNYVELSKGSLIYRMWVEDEVSIKNRIDIIKEKDLLGVAIYKMGYENDKIISIANTIK